MPSVNTNESFIYLWYIWRIVGIYPYERLRWLYHAYSAVINLAASVINPMLLFVNAFFVHDIGLMLNSIRVGPTLFASSLKQFVIFLKFSRLQEITPYIEALDRRANCNREEVLHLRRLIRQCHLMVLGIQVILMFSFTSYVLLGYLQHRLLFEAWFPFDLNASQLNFHLAFVFQFICSFFQIIQNAANVAYPTIYLNVINGHTRILCKRITRIGTDPATSAEENFTELKACVNDHRNIISLLETVQPVISLTVLIQFVTTATALCLALTYYLVFDRSLGQLINTINFMGAILWESFPVCYFGNALLDQTNALTTAIYSCNWIDQPATFRKSIIIFMQRSQRVGFIKAGLTTISLETFIAIVQFSFSVFTILSEIQ